MRRLLIILLSAGVLYTYFGRTHLNGASLMGIWRNNEGSAIELRCDGTCRITGINFTQLLGMDYYKNKRMNFSGTWNYRNYFRNIHHKKLDPDKLQLLVWDKKHKVEYCFLFSIQGEIYPWEKRDTLSIILDTKKQKGEAMYKYKQQWRRFEGNEKNSLENIFGSLSAWIDKMKMKLCG